MSYMMPRLCRAASCRSLSSTVTFLLASPGRPCAGWPRPLATGWPRAVGPAAMGAPLMAPRTSAPAPRAMGDAPLAGAPLGCRGYLGEGCW